MCPLNATAGAFVAFYEFSRGKESFVEDIAIHFFTSIVTDFPDRKIT